MESLQRSKDRLNLALEARKWARGIEYRHRHVWKSRLHDLIFGYDASSPTWSQATLLQHVVPDDRANAEKEFEQSLVTGQIKGSGGSFALTIERSAGSDLKDQIYRDLDDKPLG